MKKLTGTIDRIENNLAVVIIDSNEKKEILWPVELLAGGAREGSVVNITMKTDEIATKKAAERVQQLLHQLKNKNK